MVTEKQLTKLINNGIRLTDAFFRDLKIRVINDIKTSKDLEEFLTRTDHYTTGNAFIDSGYANGMAQIVLRGLDTRRLRARQRELFLTTVDHTTTELIKNVGEEAKVTIREIAKMGYQKGTYHPTQLAREIEPIVRGEYGSSPLLINRVRSRLFKKYGDSIDMEQAVQTELDRIAKTRARTIARTEIKRSQTIADYISSKDAGCTHFRVSCMESACDICKNNYKNKEFLIDEIENLPPFHPNCYMPDTKVFTNHGWKYFHDVNETDKILSLNPQTNETEFLDYVKLIKTHNVHGFMYHIHNKWFDTCVTPDHECFIQQRRDGGKRGRYYDPQFRKPSKLNSESKFLRCIDVDRENPLTIDINGLRIEPHDYAFFMAWFLSEGSVLHNPETAKIHAYPIKITQQIQENREIIQPVLERMSNYLGIKLAIGKEYFEFYSKELYDYLVQLGYSHEKYIPKEVFTLNKECLNLFLDNYVFGDGHERTQSNNVVQNGTERNIFTSSPRLRDGLSYIILLCGYYPSIGLHTPKCNVVKHKNGRYAQNHDVYRIVINKTKFTNFGSCTVDKIHYTGEVYCVELPKYHTLWTMRNGKTSWNGNCRCVALFYTKKDYKPTKKTINLTPQKFYNMKSSNDHIPFKSLSKGKIPSDLPSPLKTELLKFDKYYEKQYPKTELEYGYLKNLDTGETSEYKEGNINQINFAGVKLTISETDNLVATHSHRGPYPYNYKDIEEVLKSPNSRYMVVHTPQDIFIAEFNQKAFKKRNEIIQQAKDDFKNAMKRNLKYKSDSFAAEILWDNYLKNEILNKYITFRRIPK